MTVVAPFDATLAAPVGGTPPADLPSADPWPRALDDVLAGRGLRLAAQPIVDVAHGAVVGYELLARFTSPLAASPEEWFARAERLGRGAELDAVVLARALELRDFLPPDTFITVNVSPLHLGHPALASLRAAAGGLDRVVLELTEHSVVDDCAEVARRLEPWREAGAKVAIDDAGSGYAGLQWLLALSPDLVKLDRALIDHIDEDEAKSALVEMLGTFADRLDAWVLAEGVERVAELDVLARLGVPLAQGYLFRRPTVELWPAIDGEVRLHLRSRADRLADPNSVGPLVESARTRRRHEPGSSSLGVVVDGLGQPVGLDLHDGTWDRVLVVRSDEPVRVALGRALTRDVHWRWHPLVCVDELRRVVGVVRIERLVHRVLDGPGDDAPTPKEET